MTRETKLGLVVSCSFVCLLGTVLFVKMQEGGAVPQSPYAKADGSTPDIPEEPAPIQVTVAPTAPGSESSSAPAAPTGSSGENRPDPVLAMQAQSPPTLDPNVKRTAATADPLPGANKDTNMTPPVPDPAPTPAPTSPPSSPPAPNNDFSAFVPAAGLPSAPAPSSPTPTPIPQGKNEPPKPPPTLDGLPKQEPEKSSKDAAPTVPPAPDGLTRPGSETPKPELEGKNVEKGNKPAPGHNSQRETKDKEKKTADIPVSPPPGLENKNDSSPAVPFPTPDPKAAAPEGLPDQLGTTPPSPASPRGEHRPAPAPIEAPLPGTNAAPKEPAPVAPQHGASHSAEGFGLPTPGTGRLTPPPKPPSASESPSPATPIPDPVPGTGTSTSTGSTGGATRPKTPAVAPPGASPTPAPAPHATVPPLPVIPSPTPNGSEARAPGATPPPSALTTGTMNPPTPDPSVSLGKPMNPTRAGNQYAQAPARPADPLPTGSHPLPPVGAPVAGTSPPIAVPMPPGATPIAASRVPQVESYDEETYVCRANDSFEAISNHYYSSKKYAQALMLFNRNHPRATAALQKDAPVLAEGQALYIPPIRILEKQYASAIPGYKPPAPAPAPNTARTTARSLSTSPSPQYHVRKAGGEMIPIIAKDTLGNVDRWTEIYQLNKGRFDPAWPVPAGTVLVMPADAKVPPENLVSGK